MARGARISWKKTAVHKQRGVTPNDPKLSDGRGWRDRCAVGERRRQEAAGVTAAPVRCSAWLGVAVIAESVVRDMGNNGADACSLERTDKLADNGLCGGICDWADESCCIGGVIAGVWIEWGKGQPNAGNAPTLGTANNAEREQESVPKRWLGQIAIGLVDEVNGVHV